MLSKKHIFVDEKFLFLLQCFLCLSLLSFKWSLNIIASKKMFISMKANVNLIIDEFRDGKRGGLIFKRVLYLKCLT